MEGKEFTPNKTSPLLPIFEKFSTARDVSLVYGDPIEMQGRTIVPVAKVKYSVGAGGGSGYGPVDGQDENAAGGQGEGAGGAFSVKPVGIYDVTAEKTVYRPVIPIELIFMMPLLVAGLGLLMASGQEKASGTNHQKRMHSGKRCKKKGQGRKMKGLGHAD